MIFNSRLTMALNAGIWSWPISIHCYCYCWLEKFISELHRFNIINSTHQHQSWFLDALITRENSCACRILLPFQVATWHSLFCLQIYLLTKEWCYICLDALVNKTNTISSYHSLSWGTGHKIYFLFTIISDEPFHSQNHMLPCNSYDTSSDNFVLDQLTIP